MEVMPDGEEDTQDREGQEGIEEEAQEGQVATLAEDPN
jgi:hypothetical protein